MWLEANTEQKRRLQALTFPEGLTFDGEALGTPVTALIFSLLDQIPESGEGLVQPGGVEPPTYRSVVCRSIQLSYGCTFRTCGGGIVGHPGPGCNSRSVNPKPAGAHSRREIPPIPSCGSAAGSPRLGIGGTANRTLGLRGIGSWDIAGTAIPMCGMPPKLTTALRSFDSAPILTMEIRSFGGPPILRWESDPSVAHRSFGGVPILRRRTDPYGRNPKLRWPTDPSVRIRSFGSVPILTMEIRSFGGPPILRWRTDPYDRNPKLRWRSDPSVGIRRLRRSTERTELSISF
jgi:hypothetical protein